MSLYFFLRLHVTAEDESKYALRIINLYKGKYKKNPTDHLKPLADHSCQAYLTNELQVADILEWVLEQVGRSEMLLITIFLSTFALITTFEIQCRL